MNSTFVNYKNSHTVNLAHVVVFKKDFIIDGNQWVLIFFFQGGNVSWPFNSMQERDDAYNAVVKAAAARAI